MPRALTILEEFPCPTQQAMVEFDYWVREGYPELQAHCMVLTLEGCGTRGTFDYIHTRESLGDWAPLIDIQAAHRLFTLIDADGFFAESLVEKAQDDD